MHAERLPPHPLRARGADRKIGVAVPDKILGCTCCTVTDTVGWKLVLDGSSETQIQDSIGSSIRRSLLLPGQVLQQSQGTADNASADDFLPLLIFTIIKANPADLHSTLESASGPPATSQEPGGLRLFGGSLLSLVHFHVQSCGFLDLHVIGQSFKRESGGTASSQGSRRYIEHFRHPNRLAGADMSREARLQKATHRLGLQTTAGRLPRCSQLRAASFALSSQRSS